MLAKLLKHEFKATSRLLVPLYLILLLMSIINRFVFVPSSYAGNFRIIDQFLISTYIISIIVVFVVTIFYMIIRFYKNLLTDEGYLMFTLPAKTHQHITSKLITTIFWIIVSIVTVLISIFIVFASHASFPAVTNGIKEAIANLSGQIDGSLALLITELIIIFLLGMIAKILLIYLSIAVGQWFSKHKIIASFAAYMIIYTMLQLLVVILLLPFGIFIKNTPPGLSSLPQVIFPIGIMVLALGCVCFYLATNYIFKRRLNLD